MCQKCGKYQHLWVADNKLGKSLNNISIKKPIDRESDVAFNVEPLQVVGKNEQTIEGLRTSIIIDNANCPKEYKFTFELEDGDRFVTAK
mgnify:CR=1 FL=1|jgi:hypothetical protein